MIYRIKETNGKFIPQKLTFYGWSGIELDNMFLWNNSELQWKYCKCNSLEEAKEVINKYKPKYHRYP